MKKLTLCALALAAMPVMAGTPVVITTPAPAPAVSPWSVDVAMTLRTQLNDPGVYSDHGFQTIGTDLTVNYALTENDYLNLRLGYSFGDRDWGMDDGGEEKSGMEMDQHTFYIMPGYKHVWTVCDKTTVYAGVNVGIANVSHKSAFYTEVEGVTVNKVKGHDSDWGFAYSAEVGATYEICPDWTAFGALELFGTTAAPEMSRESIYAGLRFGVSTKF